MTGKPITFQMATHFLPRAALRFESLYATILNASQESHPVIHHYALNNVIEIMRLVEKPELKSRFLKEMMRIEHIVLKSTKPISHALQETIDRQIHLLTITAGNFCTDLLQDPFLQSVRNNQQAQQPDSELYVPQLLFWLEASPASRLKNIKNWIIHLKMLHDTVTAYLALLREIIQFDMIEMPNGFYQRYISPKITCHLVLLTMQKTKNIVPKIQFGHHGISIRLYHAATMQELSETACEFQLGICQI